MNTLAHLINAAFGSEAAQPLPVAPPRRRKLWEVPSRYHCPIIGTCLPVERLRKLARRARVEDAESLGDYALHSAAVHHCGERNALAEALQKALEDLYAADVRRYGAAASDEAILALWREDFERGRAAAALWAVMSHARASEAALHRVYEDVHMLSHQIGAGQRADLRRLQALERETAELRLRCEALSGEQARRLAEKDDVITTLTQRLAQALEAGRAGAEAAARLEGIEAREMAPLHQALAAAEARAVELERALRRTEGHLALLLEAAGRPEPCPSRPGDCAPAAACSQAAECDGDGDCSQCANLAGRCVLCVGGPHGQAARYRTLVEARGGRFLHHDGGIEDNPQRLPELLECADAVVCPSSHINHMAYHCLKRHCKRRGTPCVFLRSGGLGPFAEALNRLAS